MCRKLTTAVQVNLYSFHDPNLLCVAAPAARPVRGVNRTRYGCEFTLNHLVFGIGMLLLCPEGAYFTSKSFIHVQMTTLTPAPPVSGRTNECASVCVCV